MNTATPIRPSTMNTKALLEKLSLVVESHQKIAPHKLLINSVFIECDEKVFPLSVLPMKIIQRETRDGIYQIIYQFDTNLYDVRSFFQIFYVGNFHFTLNLEVLSHKNSIALMNIESEHTNILAINEAYLTLDDMENKHSRDDVEHSITVLNSNKY